MLTHMDGPRHLRLRKLISSGFTPRMTKRLEDQARGWAVRIIEEALERETVNFVQDVAYQLPMHMIADIVGIPAEDRGYIFNVVNDMLMCSNPDHPVPAAKGQELMTEIFAYGASLSKAKRAKPADDIWSLLAVAEVENEDGQLCRLQPVELDGFFVLLTAAGSETTRSAIAGGLQALLERPDQLAALRANPGLMKTATDEILRWTSPVSYFRRTVKRDTELAGVKIAEGDRVSLWYPSGNRDPRAFDGPDEFDIRRSKNEHIALGGGGPHFCLGANLARREITIMFEELLARVAGFETAGEPMYGVQGIGNPITVALTELPIRLQR
jgi:cytochrome P450